MKTFIPNSMYSSSKFYTEAFLETESVVWKALSDQTSLIHKDPPDSASSVLGLKASSRHACLD